jgi:hypothetical protein
MILDVGRLDGQECVIQSQLLYHYTNDSAQIPGLKAIVYAAILISQSILGEPSILQLHSQTFAVQALYPNIYLLLAADPSTPVTALQGTVADIVRVLLAFYPKFESFPKSPAYVDDLFTTPRSERMSSMRKMTSIRQDLEDNLSMKLSPIIHTFVTRLDCLTSSPEDFSTSWVSQASCTVPVCLGAVCVYLPTSGSLSVSST